MESLKNQMKSAALKVAGAFTPVLTDSKFKETGMITPEEFVEAGDHLVHQCPTWQWAGGDSVTCVPYLPKEKQFLTTRNVPCYRRLKAMEYSDEQESVIDPSDPEGGWVDTHASHDFNSQNTLDMSVDSKKPSMAVEATEDGSDEEPVDMEDFVEKGIVDDDPHTFREEKKPTGEDNSAESNVVATRTYDLNITYDHYYRTPRMWLTGRDEKRQYLTVDQMYEDFSADHANKTITIESHPHISGPQMASIHPCRHAEVMKKLIDIFGENGKELAVHQYLLIFLKFVQAVIPTIEYDYTRNVQM